MPNIMKTGGGSGGLKYNLFCQPTEPKVKDGIWVQSPTNFTDVEVDTDFTISSVWRDISEMPASALSGTNRVPSYIIGTASIFNDNDIRFFAHKNLSNGNGVAQSAYEYSYNITTKVYTLICNILAQTASTSSSYYISTSKIYRSGTQEFCFVDNVTGNHQTTMRYRTIGTTSWTSINVYYWYYSGSAIKTTYNYAVVPLVYLDEENNKLRIITGCGYSSYSSYAGYAEINLNATQGSATIPSTLITSGGVSTCYPIDNTNVIILPLGSSYTSIYKLNTSTSTATTVGTLPTNAIKFYISDYAIDWYSKDKIIVPIIDTTTGTSISKIGLYTISTNSWNFITLPYNYFYYKFILHQSTLYGFCAYSNYTTAGYNIAIDMVTGTVTNISGNSLSNSSIVEKTDNKLIAIGYNTDNYIQPQAYQLSQLDQSEDCLAILNVNKYSTQIINRDNIIKSLKKYSCDVLDYNSNFGTPYTFANAWLFKNGIYNEYPSYYGNGTSWVKFKN